MNYIQTITKGDTIYFIYDKNDWYAWKQRGKEGLAGYLLVMRRGNINTYWGIEKGQRLLLSIIDNPPPPWMNKKGPGDTITTITPE